MKKFSQVATAAVLAGVVSIGGAIVWSAGSDNHTPRSVAIADEEKQFPVESATPHPTDSVSSSAETPSPEVSVSPSPAISPTPKELSIPAPSKRPEVLSRTDRGGSGEDASSDERTNSKSGSSSKPRGKGTKESSSSIRNAPSGTSDAKKAPDEKQSKKSSGKKNSDTKKAPKKDGKKKKSSSQSSQYAGKMTANFVFAHNSTEKNASMIRTMGADPVTFGYRVKPAKKSAYPKSVRNAIGSKRVYSYATGIQWVSGLSSNDKKVGNFTVVNVGHNSVVVVRNDIDPQKRLVEAGKQTGARVFLGMPAPQQKSYLPDLSYKGVVDNFVRKYVKNYRAVGATGYYHHIEMPISGGSVWNGTRGLYASHNKIIAREHPGATAIIAPYLESRKAKSGASPAQSAAGAKKLMRTAHGARLLIAPQDGLGTDTTALRADKSKRHVGTTEDHFKAMRSAVGNKLWATTEAMRPAGSGRKPTSAHRVGQQLSAVRPYTQGSIGFMWNNDTGMRSVSGLGKYTVGTGKSFK